MASILPSSHFRSEDILRKLRKVIRWQSPGFDGKLRREIMLFTAKRAATLSGSTPPQK
jgi:hypothetical protein